MVIRRNPEPGRQAVLWLATAFVVLIGAAACAFIILAAVERPSRHLLIWGGLFGGVILLLTLLSVRGDKQAARRWIGLWLASRDRTNPLQAFRVGRKRSVTPTQFGTNAPPTLDSVKDAAEQNVSWVPHGPPPKRSRPTR